MPVNYTCLEQNINQLYNGIETVQLGLSEHWVSMVYNFTIMLPIKIAIWWSSGGILPLFRQTQLCYWKDPFPFPRIVPTIPPAACES